MSPSDPFKQAADQAVAEEIGGLANGIQSPFRIATEAEREAMGIGAATQLVDHKPGVKTSEFWLLVLVIVLTWLPVFVAGMSVQWATGLNTVAAVAWAYCRSLVKSA